jgi:hypothetical protein
MKVVKASVFEVPGALSVGPLSEADAHGSERCAAAVSSSQYGRQCVSPSRSCPTLSSAPPCRRHCY